MAAPRIVNIDGTELDQTLDDGEWPEKIAEAVEKALETMKENPGGEGETIQLIIKNDFEPEEDDESEDDENQE